MRRWVCNFTAKRSVGGWRGQYGSKLRLQDWGRGFASSSVRRQQRTCTSGSLVPQRRGLFQGNFGLLEVSFQEISAEDDVLENHFHCSRRLESSREVGGLVATNCCI
jgi:hypothetical protein